MHEGDDSDKPLERVNSANLTARVPDSVASGVFATGAVVLQSPTEVMIDFVQGLANPRRIGVRIVMPPGVALQFVEALQANLGIYKNTFGRRPTEPQPVLPPDADDVPREAPADDGDQPGDADDASGNADDASSDADDASGTDDESPRASPSAQQDQQPIADAYDQLKVSDEVLGGAYANTVTIAHTGCEFHFDFINRCFPRSIVNARVYMAAPRVPALLDSLKRSLRLS